jgi:MFS family permease
MALLARIAKNQVHQGKLMAGNGLVHTLASVVSPAAGALLVARIGFELAFYLLGWGLIVTALCALIFIRDMPQAPSVGIEPDAAQLPSVRQMTAPLPWLVYTVPVAMSCAQGILSFELPLMSTSKNAMLTTGLLFSVVSLGALVTLSMLFLNKLSPYLRTLWGALMLALTYFLIAAGAPLPLAVLLFIVGMSKGVIFPALSSLLIELSGGTRYGRTFSILSIAFSIGSFLGPMLAGQLRDYISPYFIAFLALMLTVSVLPFHRIRSRSARTRPT